MLKLSVYLEGILVKPVVDGKWLVAGYNIHGTVLGDIQHGEGFRERISFVLENDVHCP
jgi:hypothetical protein